MRARYKARKAPKIANGVPSRMLNGSDQLSYWAARIRNTNYSEKISTTPADHCDFFSWNDMLLQE